MKQTAINYGKVLFELGVSKEDVTATQQIYEQTKELQKVLLSPIISCKSKHRIIEKLFPVSMHSFLKKVCDYKEVDELSDIFAAYEDWLRKSQGIMVGTLYYMTEPTKEQLNNIEQGLCSKLGCNRLQLSLKEDHTLIGGFVIRIGDLEIDQSILGSINSLKQKLTRR